MITLALTLDIHPWTSRVSVSAAPSGSLRSNDVQWGSTQGSDLLSLGEAESPLPGQVYVTAQMTCG